VYLEVTMISYKEEGRLSKECRSDYSRIDIIAILNAF